MLENVRKTRSDPEVYCTEFLLCYQNKKNSETSEEMAGLSNYCLP